MQQLKQRCKGLAALVLAAVMVFTMIPMSAMAEDETEYKVIICGTDLEPLDPEQSFTLTEADHSGELPELPEGAYCWNLETMRTGSGMDGYYPELDWVGSKESIYEVIQREAVTWGRTISSLKLEPIIGDYDYKLVQYTDNNRETYKSIKVPQGMTVAELSADLERTGYSLAENESIVGWNLWKTNLSGKVYEDNSAQLPSQKVKMLTKDDAFTIADYNQAYNAKKVTFTGGYTAVGPALEPVYHTHEQSEEWQTDAKKHWHDCSVHTTYIYRSQEDSKTGKYQAYKEEQQNDYVCDETLDAAEHTMSSTYKTDAKEHWRVCDVCGYEMEAKAEHSWDSGAVTTPATTEKEGVKTYTCTVCKATKTEAVPKTAKPTTPTTPTKQSLSKAQITGLSSKTYNGKAQTQSKLKVTYEGKTLKQGTDYTVSYKNNTKAGTATVTVTGIGNYTDSKAASFTIKKAEQSISKVSGSYTKAYKTNFTLSPKAKGKITYKSSNTKVATVNSKGKVSIKGTGKVTITVSAKATSCYKAASKKVTIYAVPEKAKLKEVKSAKGKVEAEWKKDSNASGYQILYSTDKKMKKAKTMNCSKKDTTATIKNLKKNKTCYVKIRAYKTIDGKKYYGAYSDKMSVKVK